METPSNAGAIPAAMLQKLDAVMRHDRLVRLQTGLTRACAVLLTAMLAMMAVDWIAAFHSPFWRWTVSLAALACGVAAFALGCVLPLLHRRSLDSVARQVDLAHPSLEERCQTLTEFARSHDKPEIRGSEAMIRKVALQTAALSGNISPEAVVSKSGLVLAGKYLGAAAAVMALFFIADFSRARVLTERLLAPGADITLTRLSAKTGDMVIGKGEDATLKITATGKIPDSASLTMRSTNGHEETLLLRKDARATNSAAGEFVYTASAVVDSFDYRATAGDGETVWQHVTVVERPKLAQVQLKIVPPAYSKLPTIDQKALPRQVRALEGSQMQVSFQADQPLASLDLKFADGKVRHLTEDAGHVYHFDSLLTNTLAFEPVLVNTHHLDNEDRPNCEIVVYPDLPPTVTITSPSDSITAQPDDTVKIEFEARDDLGVAKADLVVTVSSEGDSNAVPVVIPIPLDEKETGAKLVKKSVNLDLSQFKLQQGQELSYFVRATDTKNDYGLSTPDPNAGNSQTGATTAPDIAQNQGSQQSNPGNEGQQNTTQNSNQQNNGQQNTAQNGGQQSTAQNGGQQSTAQNGGQQSTAQNGGQQSTAQNGGQQSTAQNGGQQTTAQNGGQQSTAQNGGQQTTAQNGGQQSTAQNGGQQSTAQNGGQQSTAQNGGQQSTAQNGGQQSTAQNGGQQSTAQNGGQQSTAQNGGQQSTAQHGGQQSTAQNGGQQSTAQNGGQQSTAQNGGQQSTAQNGGQQSTAQNGGQQSTAQNGGQQSTAQNGGQQSTAQNGGQQQQTLSQQNHIAMGSTNASKSGSQSSGVQSSQNSMAGAQNSGGQNNSQNPGQQNQGQQNTNPQQNHIAMGGSTNSNSGSQSPGGSQPPPNSMSKRVLDAGGQTASAQAMKITVDQWARSFDGQMREKAELAIDPTLKLLDELLLKAHALTESNLAVAQTPQGLSQAQSPSLEDDKDQIRQAEHAADDLKKKSTGTPYAFIGLQISDIADTHIAPAREELGEVALVAAKAKDDRENLGQASFHIAQARKMLADLTKSYESAKKDNQLADTMQEIKKMHQIFLEDTQALLKTPKPTLNPQDRKMAEVDDDFVTQYNKLLEEQKKIMAELAKALANDPQMLRRYMAMMEMDSTSLRDQMTLLAQRQQALTKQTEQWAAADEKDRPALASQFQAGQLSEQAEIAEMAGKLHENMITWLPEGVAQDQEPIASALSIAAEGAHQAVEAAGKASPGTLAASVDSARKALDQFRLLHDYLPEMSTGDDDPKNLSVFAATRLDETSELITRESGWIKKMEALTNGNFTDAAQVDQHRLTLDTTTLKEKLDAAAPSIQAMSPEIHAKSDELTHTVEKQILPEESRAEDGLFRKSVKDAASRQEGATTGFAKAEGQFDELLKMIIAKLDAAPPPSAGDVGRAQTLEEMLNMLKQEKKMAEGLGIPNRPINVQVMRDWLSPNSQSGQGQSQASGRQSPGGRAQARSTQQQARGNYRQSQRMDDQARNLVRTPPTADDSGKPGDAAAKQGPKPPANAWNTIASQLGDELRQSRDNVPPEQYRQAIEQYFNTISETVPPGAAPAKQGQ